MENLSSRHPKRLQQLNTIHFRNEEECGNEKQSTISHNIPAVARLVTMLVIFIHTTRKLSFTRPITKFIILPHK